MAAKQRISREQDRSGALTSLLGDKGYMSHVSPEHLLNASPEYFIEVKSTTLPCETAFFMSKYQYKRVRRSSAFTVQTAQNGD
jgi:hypothetical protein